MSDREKGRQLGSKGGEREVLFEDEALFDRFLAEAQDHIPSEETLELIYRRAVAEGKVHPEKIDAAWEHLLARLNKELRSTEQWSVRSESQPELVTKTAWFYVNFLMDREGKSAQAIAAELGVSFADLSALRQSAMPIEESNLLNFCREFTQAHPQYSLPKLLRLLKRAFVLFSMTQESDQPMLKAARKKKE